VKTKAKYFLIQNKGTINIEMEKASRSVTAEVIFIGRRHYFDC
jgi:hypothetical protein